jgi:hypothetical protein
MDVHFALRHVIVQRSVGRRFNRRNLIYDSIYDSYAAESRVNRPYRRGFASWIKKLRVEC